MSGRLILVRPADNQSMAQVSACDQRYSSIDRAGRRPDRASEGQMLLVSLMRKPDHHHRAAPSCFVQVVQRDQRSVIEWIVAIQLTQLHSFFRGGNSNRTEHRDVVRKRKPDIRRIKLAEVTLELKRGTGRERVGIERRMRGYDNDSIRFGKDEPPCEFPQRELRVSDVLNAGPAD